MTKNEFLSQLHRQLLSLPEQERRDIIQDFEEHFSIGADKGKTEEQICEDLGDPRQCAQQYLNPTAEEGGQAGAGTVPPFQPGPPYQAPPPYPNMRPQYPPNSSVANQVNRTGFAVLLALVLFLAVPGYPAAIGLIIAFIAVLIAGFAVGIVLNSWMIAAVFIMASLMLLSIGMLVFLGLTWALKACIRKLKVEDLL